VDYYEIDIIYKSNAKHYLCHITNVSAYNLMLRHRNDMQKSFS